MSSELKYFYVFNLPPSKKILWVIPLKKACITFTFIPVAIISTLFLIELFKSNNTNLYIIFKHSVYSIMNFVAFTQCLKSQRNFDVKLASSGNFFMLWSFCLHFIIFIFNLLSHATFSSISLIYLFSYFSNKINSELPKERINDQEIPQETYVYFFTIPNMIYTLFELFITWICYSYTKNLEMGKDALVDGLSFDRYAVNFESENNSEDDQGQGRGIGAYPGNFLVSGPSMGRSEKKINSENNNENTLNCRVFNPEDDSGVHKDKEQKKFIPNKFIDSDSSDGEHYKKENQGLID